MTGPSSAHRAGRLARALRRTGRACVKIQHGTQVANTCGIMNHSINPSWASEAEARFLELVQEFDTATLITRASAGTLRGRPMEIAAADGDGTLWFFSELKAGKVTQLAGDSRAMVTLANGLQFVTINGNVEIVREPGVVRALWKDRYKIWFHEVGVSELGLLRFSPFDGEYWDGWGTRGVRHGLRKARAWLEGRPLRRVGDPRTYGRIVV